MSILTSVPNCHFGKAVAVPHYAPRLLLLAVFVLNKTLDTSVKTQQFILLAAVLKRSGKDIVSKLPHPSSNECTLVSKIASKSKPNASEKYQSTNKKQQAKQAFSINNL